MTATEPTTTTRTEWAVRLANGRVWTSNQHTETSVKQSGGDPVYRTVTVTTTEWVDAPGGAA